MAYSGDLLQINGQKVPGIKEYKVSYNKLWKDADRNMNGDVRATLIGIFPKIELTIRPSLTEDEMSQLINLLDRAYFPVTYFDPKTKGTITAQYYASDYTTELLDRRGYYKEMTVSLVPVSKR